MIYVPDSNILSEVIKPQPNQRLQRKYFEHIHEIYIATTVWYELNFGLNIMPVGKKRNMVETFLLSEVATFPMLSYTQKSASIHAEIRATARKKGNSLPFADSQIAAIALANDAVLVTRNVADFAGIDGLKVENWFE